MGNCENIDEPDPILGDPILGDPILGDPMLEDPYIKKHKILRAEVLIDKFDIDKFFLRTTMISDTGDFVFPRFYFDTESENLTDLLNTIEIKKKFIIEYINTGWFGKNIIIDIKPVPLYTVIDKIIAIFYQLNRDGRYTATIVLRSKLCLNQILKNKYDNDLYIDKKWEFTYIRGKGKSKNWVKSMMLVVE